MIKAIFIDAIKTLFSPYPSEPGLYKKVIFDTTGKVMSEAELAPIIKRAMQETEELDAVRNNSLEQWEHYPIRIAELIGCEKSVCAAVGERIRYETWGNPENYRLYEDVIPTLKLLKEKNIFIACVSNEDGWLSNFFDHFGITQYFEFILTSAEIGVEKPNPKIFENALSRTVFRHEEVLFVGDSLVSDYNGSKAVGMKPILIDRDDLNKDNSIVAIKDLTKILDYI